MNFSYEAIQQNYDDDRDPYNDENILRLILTPLSHCLRLIDEIGN